MTALIPWLALAAMVAVAPARADSGFPRLFAATYTVAFNGKEAGVMQRTLVRERDGFLFRSELKATHGLYALLRVKISESSRWRLQGNDAVALEYASKQSGIKKKESSARFDWTRKVVAVIHKKQQGELPATAGMTDKLLYQLLLMRDLASDRRPLHYTVVDGSKVREYPIEILGEETIDTPLGRLQTVKVRYQKPGSDRSTTLWCAKSLNFLPVKLDHRESDDEQTSALIQSLAWSDAGKSAAGTAGQPAP
jgi:hypothetical protein